MEILLKPVFISNFVFAATDTAIFRSSGPGEPWEVLGLKYDRASELAVGPDDILYVAADSVLFRSTDHGDTWAPTSLQYTKIESLAFNSNGHLFAAVDDLGVLRSTDGGQSWDTLSSGMNYPYITALAFDAADFAYAGSAGGGVFRSTATTAAREVNRFPAVQVFPNPATDVVTAVFTLQVPSTVRAELLSPDGRIVRSRIAETAVGPVQILLPLAGLPAGIYTLRLNSGWGNKMLPVVVKR